MSRHEHEIARSGSAALRLGRVLGLLLVTLALGPALAHAQQVATLSGYRGKVEVVRAGKELTIHPGLALQTGDIVLTKRGVATVVFSDTSQLRIRPDSRVAISQTPGKRDVEIFLGKVWFFVVSQKEAVTQFRTGTTITAVRGTSGEFAMGQDGYYIGCLSGKLEVTVPGYPQPFILGPNMGLFVPFNGPPVPYPFSEGAFAGMESGYAFEASEGGFLAGKSVWIAAIGAGAVATGVGFAQSNSDGGTLSP